jgi:large subunit ribosomal protein L11
MTGLLHSLLGIEKGSGTTHHDNVGKLTRAQLREIAEHKARDLNAASIEAAERIIEGTARSMGIEVE